MTKHSGIRPTRAESQADLFGGAPPAPSSKKSAETARRPPPALAKATQTARSNRNTQTTEPDALLNARQAAARLGLSKSTVDKMRAAGKGPRFIKSTDRAVRYDPADLDAWIDARRRTSNRSET